MNAPSTMPGMVASLRSDRFRRILSVALVALIAVLVVEVFLETWLQTMTGPISTDPVENLARAAQWPKQLKSALYFGIAGLALLKILIENRWRQFRTPADLALAGLGAVMLIAGLVNDSSVQLMGQAMFVYFRGVIVFYAIRVTDLDRKMLRWLLATAAGLLAINVVLALWQMVGGRPAYRRIGWVDLQWADQGRAQGLLPHPNHLGHTIGLALLGLTALFLVVPAVKRWWWAVVAVLALALSASQSRESIIAVLFGIAVIWLLRRTHTKRAIALGLIVLLATVVQISYRPANRAEWERRINNALSAIHLPTFAPNGPADPTETPPPNHEQEVRVLYLKQSAKLLPKYPVFGFGIGQFGGVVAQKDNPNWDHNPKFGPGGFDRHGFRAVQVDSFWLHLVMEAGVLGLLAYGLWLVLLIRPLVPRGRRNRSGPGAMDPPALWAVGSMTFAVLVAFLSPSFEDPLFPPLLFLIIGVAWWFGSKRRTKPAAAVAALGPTIAAPASTSTVQPPRRPPAGAATTRAAVPPVRPGPSPSYGPAGAADATALLPALRDAQPPADEAGPPSAPDPPSLIEEIHSFPRDQHM